MLAANTDQIGCAARLCVRTESRPNWAGYNVSSQHKFKTEIHNTSSQLVGCADGVSQRDHDLGLALTERATFLQAQSFFTAASISSARPFTAAHQKVLKRSAG